jgi:hypothetical protein
MEEAPGEGLSERGRLDLPGAKPENFRYKRQTDFSANGWAR